MSRVALFGQISEINDHLYLSGAGVLRPERLKQKNVSCVVNATVEEPNAHLPGIDCVRIRVEDSPYAHLDHYFDLVADKIRSVRDRGGRTLVHCVAGVSRSATLCIVYLMKHERMSLRQAYHYVKAARPIIRPNLGFWKQMVEYERKLRGHNTVTLIQVDHCPLPFPDVYSTDLRKHILAHPSTPPHHDPQLIALQKKHLQQQTQRQQEQLQSRLLSASAASKSPSGMTSASTTTIIPVQVVGKRRGLSLGSGDNLKYRLGGSSIGGRAALNGSASSANGHLLNGSSSTGHGSASLTPAAYSTWRVSSFLSPAPSRRPNSVLSGGGAPGAKRTDSGSGGLFGHLYNSSLFPAF